MQHKHIHLLMENNNVHQLIRAVISPRTSTQYALSWIQSSGLRSTSELPSSGWHMPYSDVQSLVPLLLSSFALNASPVPTPQVLTQYMFDRCS